MDPIFLPAELAYRFFNAYKTVIHPLFPVLRIDSVRESIYGAYTLGVAEPKPRQLDNLAYKSDRLERARDLIVLAFGAQIEGGDGDAQCHKDVARAWSEVLKQKAKEIMLEHGQGKGGVDLVNLWVVMAAFSRSYGNSDGQWRRSPSILVKMDVSLTIRAIRLPDRGARLHRSSQPPCHERRTDA